MYAVKKSVLLKSATSRKVKPVKKKSALFASSGAVLALVLGWTVFSRMERQVLKEI